ncbi:hypothetical protein EMCRGX_G002359 [Ephydatia muelleri]
MTSAADFTKSAFWVRKMQRIFTIADFDKDGVFSSEDWDKYMQYAMNQKQLTERQYQRFTKLFQKMKPLWIPEGRRLCRNISHRAALRLLHKEITWNSSPISGLQ